MLSGSDMGFAPLRDLPRGAVGVMREILRHLLKRPIVGICAVARDDRERVLLVRRADTGTWALPGGTLEWGEQLARALPVSYTHLPSPRDRTRSRMPSSA